MAVNPNRQKLIHLNSATVKLPEGVLNKGEIAVQYANEDPALYIEKADGSLAKFVSTDGVGSLIGSAISAATEDFIALKAEVTEQVGEVAADLSGLSAVVVTSVVVNDVTATTADGVASVTVDSDDVKVGTAITYSGETLSDTASSVTAAIQAVADKAESNEAAIAEIAKDRHTHENKEVLDAITSEKVASWDNAVASAHTHENKVELDLIKEGDVAKWNALSGAATVVVSARTTSLGEGILKSYDIYQGEDVVGSIDIPKDLVVTSGGIITISEVKYLRLFIANQEEPVDIAVSELVDAYTEGNGIEISESNVVSVKAVEANGLSVDENGIAMAAASAEGAGAMSAADFVKLAGIESGASVNVIEGVQVNGADLTVDENKKVNVTVTAGTTNGTIAVNGTDVAVTGLGSAAFEDATAFDASGAADTVKTELIGDMSGDTKTLGALQAAIAKSEGAVTELSGAVVSKLEAIVETFGDYATSADTVAAIEAVSGQFNNYATSADTVAAIEAVSGQFNNYATSADTVAAIESVSGQFNNYATSADTVAAIEALADSSIRGLAVGAKSGAIVDDDNNLDFTSFGIDCGTY